MIVDTHLHLIDKANLTYPWLAGFPALDRNFLYEAYARKAARLGIASAIHMEVDVLPAEIEAETAYVQRLSRQADSLICAAIASCRPETPEFAAYLERQLTNPFIKGFRRILHFVPKELLENTVLRENLKRMEGTGLSFDLIVQQQDLPKAAELVDRAPDLQFILDHCGGPDVRAGKEQPWWADVAALAKRSNVVVKLSGIITYTDPEGWSVKSLRPFVDHIVRNFGWERIVWGSDWPLCNLGGGLAVWVAATQALVADATEAERVALLRGNAQRIWKLAD